MVTKQHTTNESTDRTSTHVVSLSALIKLNSVSVNTGDVKVLGINGSNVTVEVSNGSSVHQELKSGSYTPSDSKTVSSSESSSSRSFPSSMSYNSAGYVGTLYKSGDVSSWQTGGSYTPAQSKSVTSRRSIVVSYADWKYTGGKWELTYVWMSNVGDKSPISYNSGGYSGTLYFQNYEGNASDPQPPSYTGYNGEETYTNRYQTAVYMGTVWTEASDTRRYSYSQNYSGTVTKPAVDTRTYTKYYQYELTFDYEGNQAPGAIAITPFNTEMGGERSLLMTDIFTDPDGDSMTFAASSSNTQAVTVTRSSGNPNIFNVRALAVGTADITFTATDARGESTSQVMKTTVMNRLPVLTLTTGINGPVFEGTSINLAGSIHDPDTGHIVNVKYQINNQTPRAIMTQVSAGSPISFSKSLLFRDKALWDGSSPATSVLTEGTNHILSVWGEDDRGGRTPNQITSFTVTHNRSPNVSPMPDISENTGVERGILLTNYFTDPDGDVLKYTATSANTSVATVAVTGQSLNIQTIKSGQTLVAISADDNKGRTVSGSFYVNVMNRKPTIKVYRADGSEAYVAEHLGDHVSAFDLQYSVEDPDALDKLNVTERVNGKDVRVIKDVARGVRRPFDLTNAWGHVVEGSNTLSVLVTDSSGGSTEVSHGFRATGNELRFSLKAPVVTSVAAERFVVSGHTAIADGATFNVMACNNALDENPTWEDVTTHFAKGTVHNFANRTKTDANWAVDVEFRVTQGTSVQLSAINGFGFAFE